ncbi:hypothetical protein ACIQYF_08560 [Pseudomonas sp. NPDC096917]|uniref:hypothetical protein n=1 Tax=Pseudomonas sp. NPDC096917 TaxID=3364483 RepID=UPI00383B0EF7
MDLTSENLMRQMEILAQLDGKPTYELAEFGKNNIDVMRLCCDAEELNYWSQVKGARICAAPFYFERVAILNRKKKDYTSEIRVIERWKAIIGDYKSQPMVRGGRAALVHKGPRSIAIAARLPKAKDLLRAQRAKENAA